MNNIDYTKIERPVEPAFSNEDPEGWVEVLAWEEARADKLEQEVVELKESLRDLAEKFEHSITCQGRNPESWGAYRKAKQLLNK